MRHGDEHDQAPLEGALRAPGTPDELSEEARYVAMFRAAQDPVPVVAPGGARRAAMRRLGAGSTLALVFAVASAGVAAAYSRSLPDPVQRAFHSVLSPIGVPPAEPRQQPSLPQARATAAPTPPDPSAAPSPATPSGSAAEPSGGSTPSSSASASSTLGAAPSAGPTDAATPSGPATPTDAPTDDTSVSPSPTAPSSPTGTPAPTTSPLPTPTTPPSEPGTPTPTGTPAAPVVAPASVRIVSAGAAQRVAPGGTAVVAGEVRAADGAPVAGAAVVLQARTDGAWHRVSVTRTAADGSVAVATGPLDQSTSVRLRSSGLTSTAWRLVVQPSLTVAVQSHPSVTTLSVAATGGRAGDAVVLLAQRDGMLVTQARGVLDAAGGVRFDVATPTRSTRYVVRLPATSRHAFAQTPMTLVPPATTQPSPTPSPTSSTTPSSSASPAG